MTSQSPNPNMDDPTTDLSRDPVVTAYMLASSQDAADAVLRSYAVQGQQYIGNIKVVTSLSLDDIGNLPDPPMLWCITDSEINSFSYRVMLAAWGPPTSIDKVLQVVNVGKAIRTPNNPNSNLPVR